MSILNNLPVGLIKSILDKHSDEIEKSLLGFVKDEWEKFKIDFEKVYETYFIYATDKYSKIKTIFNPEVPVPIYSFFVTPNLSRTTNEDEKEIITMNSVNDAIGISNFLLIKGDGGIGKSTLMKHFFLSAISLGEYIPVYIELKGINKYSVDYTIEDIIFNELNRQGSTIKKEYLEYAIKQGCFIFLLDAYDEISSDKTEYFTDKLKEFCDRYPINNYIVTSRPNSDFYEFPRFTIAETCPFTQEQALELIQKIRYGNDIKADFIEQFNRELFSAHKSFATNPLLICIMLITFREYKEIPSKLHLFYSKAFDAMFFKHDDTKDGFKRELLSNLDIESFKIIFSMFCIYTYSINRTEFTLDELGDIFRKIRNKSKHIHFDVDKFICDLKNAVCVLAKDGNCYYFTHRSFQEYFSAVFLIDKPDMELTKISINMICKDPRRSVRDDVFSMIRDMNRDRFNLSILVPLIDQLSENTSLTPEQFWLEVLFFTCSIHCEKPFVQSISSLSSPVCFIRKFLRIDYYSTVSQNPNCFVEAKSKEALKTYVSNNYEPNEHKRVYFTPKKIVDDPELLKLFKKGSREGNMLDFAINYKNYLIQDSNSSFGLPEFDELFQ